MSDRDDASAWRIEMAGELAGPYREHDGVELIVLGGSPGKGLSDEYSDLDVVVYWEDFDLPWLEEEPLRGFGAERKFFRQLGPGGSWLESYYFGALKADFGHVTFDQWKAWTDPVLEGRELSLPMQKAMAGFAGAVCLHGEARFETERARVAPYPEGLGEKMVKAHLGFFQKGVLARQGLERGDFLFFRDGLCAMLKKVLGILAGLNRVYLDPGEPRWLEHEFSELPVQPADCWRRMVEILEGDREQAAERLEALLDETLDLVEEHMPALDLSRLRRGFDTTVEACSQRPRTARGGPPPARQ